jgi:hypothetical protein
MPSWHGQGKVYLLWTIIAPVQIWKSNLEVTTSKKCPYIFSSFVNSQSNGDRVN